MEAGYLYFYTRFPSIYHLSDNAVVTKPLYPNTNNNLTLAYTCIENNCWWSTNTTVDGLKYYIISDHVVQGNKYLYSKGSLGMLMTMINGTTIIAFYTFIILYCSSLIRSLILYNPWEVMYSELENCQPILDIGEGIYISRYSRTE